MKYCIGPMTKNIVDTIIRYTDDTGNVIGFIPSRRQVDYNGGYVNGWNTLNFVNYVRSKSNNIPIIRDHGGPKQGQVDDDGSISFSVDSVCLDGIHIDVWKKYPLLSDAIEATVNSIKNCLSINQNLFFEIGTEESIRKYEAEELDTFIRSVKEKLGADFSKITYAVIQSGTSLKSTINTGKYNDARLSDMIDVCKKYGVKSKEHNGDYIDMNSRVGKFNMGLDCINIAPEFGVIETQEILNNINEEETEILFDVCYKSNRWVKWVPEGFNPHLNKIELIRICGHYVRNTDFVNNIVNKNNIDCKIKEAIYNKLIEIHGK